MTLRSKIWKHSKIIFYHQHRYWLSKASRRKKALEKKKDSSMILLETPQKELLKSCKKVQKAPKRKAKNSRKRLYSNKSSNVDEIQILLSDHSSDNFSDPCAVEKNLLVPDFTNEPAIGDYVLVEFKTFPRK